MADWKTVLEIARRLPETEEYSSLGQPALRVRGKLFAWLSPKREALEVLVVRVDPDEKRLLLESNPDVYFLTPHYEDYPCVPVRLERIGHDELRERIEDAWLSRAPKRLVAEFVATER
jgi:hypothetical protein